MKIITVLSILLTACVSQGADLSGISNNELIAELSRRLSSGGSGNGEAFSSASCSGGEIDIQVAGTSGNGSHKSYTGSSCLAQLKSISRKLGSFSGVRVVAICAGGELVRVKMSSNGSIDNTKSYVGSECLEQADMINSSN